MTTPLRTRASALLDVLGVGTEHDQSRVHVERARSFAACFRGDGSAIELARRLDVALEGGRKGQRAAAELEKVSRYPVEALGWSWANTGQGEGELNRYLGARSNREHPWTIARPTAFGAALGWWMAPQRARGTLVLSGDTGTGKSVVAVYVAVCEQGTFLSAADVGEIALGKGKEALAEARYAPLLIVDELGRESHIGPTQSRLVSLLQTRHDGGLATLITTQLPADHPKEPSLSFRERYGHHLLDRIERGGGRWFDLTYRSRRSAARPNLSGLLRSCKIAYLVERVDQLTAKVFVGHGREADIAELAGLMEVADGQLEAAVADRVAFTEAAISKASGLGMAGEIVAGLAADG